MTRSQIEKEIKQIIFKRLDPRKYRIFVYGSRATGRARKWSDYDIGILGEKPLPTMTKFEIEDQLEESDIPVNVEVVDFAQTPENFNKVALLKTIPWTII